jgi:hypothetical protein
MSTVNKDWKTWSPFQSPEVREICTHMTDRERSRGSWQSGLYGLQIGVTMSVPVIPAIFGHGYLSLITAIVLLAAFIVSIPLWRKAQKRFLCSTAWARENGFTPEHIRLLVFRL